MVDLYVQIRSAVETLNIGEVDTLLPNLTVHKGACGLRTKIQDLDMETKQLQAGYVALSKVRSLLDIAWKILTQMQTGLGPRAIISVNPEFELALVNT